jgi:hypothetical protein
MWPSLKGCKCRIEEEEEVGLFSVNKFNLELVIVCEMTVLQLTSAVNAEKEGKNLYKHFSENFETC